VHSAANLQASAQNSAQCHLCGPQTPPPADSMFSLETTTCQQLVSTFSPWRNLFDISMLAGGGRPGLPAQHLPQGRHPCIIPHSIRVVKVAFAPFSTGSQRCRPPQHFDKFLWMCKSHLCLQEEAARAFRPSVFHMDGSVQTVSLVLCNDKPQTFGAPDVLRLSVDQLTVKYVMERRFHDRPPDQVPPPPAPGRSLPNDPSAPPRPIVPALDCQQLRKNVTPLLKPKDSSYTSSCWCNALTPLKSLHRTPDSL